ncbi:thiol-disulfide isomerase/thioredoxin [Luteibacter sp. Sphag1AF]|uniref:TlpA family protein disulfide reductase n=1 Tax=Luteibacter sp. Sphag1AF TaxID=2587031 RepID=UPI00160A78B6|nr:TlpA disulfide reductase family protein [Luteibacter sp. Sphag1AF]MBB3225503.1 thiol-disulfide isomerase/thioredoxin [Luteibacter sp. Sphag1AF]
MTLRLFALGALALATFPAMSADPVKPALKVTTVTGKTFDLAAQRGHWVIVNYWATWCVPCIAEMPDISAFVASHPNVKAIGLAFEDTEKKDVLAFLDKHKVVYPIAQIDPTEPPKDFGMPRGLPTTYLIAPDGHIAEHFVGPVTEKKLGDAIARGQ